MPQLGLAANNLYQKVRAKVSEKVLPIDTSAPPITYKNIAELSQLITIGHRHNPKNSLGMYPITL